MSIKKDKNMFNLHGMCRQLHVTLAKRLIKSLRGRTIVLPLSGGQDSRLIAIMLRRLGYENVICFSYGKEGNAESITSRKIADYLGYKWIFIPYTIEKWKEWYNSDLMKKYMVFGDNLTSLPHIQDFPAVLEMKKQGLIPRDSIFVPGHAADFIQGSHIPHYFVGKKVVKKKEIIETIYKAHYNLRKNPQKKTGLKEVFERRIYHIVGDISASTPEIAADIIEYWNWQERQAKFIANSIRVYEFFGYEWRLPLWDNELMNYWSKITVDNRVKRALYYKYVNKKQADIIKKLSLNVQKRENKLKLLYKKAIQGKLLRLDGFIRKIYIMRSRLKQYRTHPMQWYGIYEYNKYKKSIFKLGLGLNINSLLVEDYLNNLEKQ